MLNMPLNMIRAFAAVFDTGGIRPAARSLGVSHSSVLRFVRELEAHIGMELTHKKTKNRHLQFTAAGEALGKAAIASLSGLETAISTITEAHHRKSVTIETTPSVASRWLLPRLANLEAALGGVEISLVVDQRVRSFPESGADLAIRSGQGPWSDAESMPLMDDKLIPVMSPQYWRSMGEPHVPADLKRCRLIHDRDPKASWATWKSAHGPAKLDVRSGPRFPSADLLLSAAEQGIGVALVRHSLAAQAIDRGHLLAPFNGLCVPLPKSVWIVLPLHGMRRQAVTKVVDWLHDQAAAVHAHHTRP